MTITDLVDNPYVGPRPFEQREADRFFGRETEARELLARIISERLLLFCAPSGAGKTSLLNTRLIPGLKAKGYAVLPVVRVGAELPSNIGPVDNLFVFNALLHLHQGEGEANRFAKMKLTDFLDRLASSNGEHYHYDNGDSIEENVDYETPIHVLIIDQFEEIFTTHLDRWKERESFFRQLDEAMTVDPMLWVVLLLREDYVAALDPYAGLLTNRLRARFYMQRMEYDAALAAIRQPAEKYGRPFAPGVAEKLVDNLRQVSVHQGTITRLGQFVEPAQLQLICYQLWERLRQREIAPVTEQDLAELGNVDKALANFYEQALAKGLRQGLVKLPDLEKLLKATQDYKWQDPHVQLLDYIYHHRRLRLIRTSTTGSASLDDVDAFYDHLARINHLHHREALNKLNRAYADRWQTYQDLLDTPHMVALHVLTTETQPTETWRQEDNPMTRRGGSLLRRQR
jgi:SpoVK/Ycf46/Vps4 family AAA+-type ATPase